MTSTARKSVPTLSREQICNISGWLRENQGVEIKEDDLPRLFALSAPTLPEKAEKLLSHLSKKFPRPGDHFTLSGPDLLELEGITWACSEQEVRFLAYTYLTEEMAFLKIDNTQRKYFISPKGWGYIDSLRKGNVASAIGFVAMWFDPQTDSAYVAIEKAIRDAGYSPLRIDKKEHNNTIDDEIVAGIRRSKFLVADFTGNRGGVYFEAGLALGLGLQVIWLCRKDHFSDVHFDTRQYPHIVWENGKLSELANALKARIEARMGHGPVN